MDLDIICSVLFSYTFALSITVCAFIVLSTLKSLIEFDSETNFKERQNNKRYCITNNRVYKSTTKSGCNREHSDADTNSSGGKTCYK